jgi:hypothetical protein
LISICAHNLEIENGRYFQINRTERICKICNDLEIEDENHFLWQCEKYRKEREILFKKVSFYKASLLTASGMLLHAFPLMFVSLLHAT